MKIVYVVVISKHHSVFTCVWDGCAGLDLRRDSLRFPVRRGCVFYSGKRCSDTFSHLREGVGSGRRIPFWIVPFQIDLHLVWRIINGSPID